MATGNAALDFILWLLGFLGFGGICGGVIAHILTKKVGQKMDEEREERKRIDNARLESELLIHEGVCATGHLAEAAALAIKEGKSNGKTDKAIEYYRAYRDKQEAFMRRQMAERLHEGG